MNETVKRVLIGLLAFAYPAALLFYSVQLDPETNTTLRHAIFWALVLPVVLASGAIVFAAVQKRKRQPRMRPPVIQPHQELLFFLLAFVVFLSTGLFFTVRGSSSVFALFDVSSILFVLHGVFGFMFVLNRGHALRWLYSNPNDPKVRLNHHLKAGAAYSIGGVLGTGIGIVQILSLVDDFSNLIPAMRICILTSLYSLVFVLHHSFCRMWVYGHTPNEHPNVADLGSGLLSYLTGIGSSVLIMAFIYIRVPEIGEDIGDAFDTFMNVLLFATPTSAQQEIVQLAGPLGWLLGLGVTLSIGISLALFSVLQRSQKPARKLTPANWIELSYNIGLLFFLVAFGMLLHPDNLLVSAYVFFQVVFVSTLFIGCILFAQLLLSTLDKWETYGSGHPNMGEPSRLNFMWAPYLFCFSTIGGISLGGSVDNPAFIFLAALIIFGVLRSRFKQSKLESIIDKQTQKINQDKQALEVLDKQKTHFFQTISHELRTPLTLIMNPLAERLAAEPHQEELQIASNNAHRLLRLVNQLLDFQKVSAGRFVLKPKPRSIKNLLLRCSDYFRSAAAGRNIHFVVTVEGANIASLTDDFVVLVDSDAFEKIVMNYLSNALKYTPIGGTVELGTTIAADHARVFVADNGPGIPKEAQPNLFEVFTQVDGGTTREFEGTGLGLALCKELTEEMGGQVGVESDVGQGSLFWASFPLSQQEAISDLDEVSDKNWMIEAQQRTESPEEQSLSEVDEALALILVVDDNQDMRHLIAKRLKQYGYQVITAIDGEDGFNTALARQPDLIVSDWMMPKMSGPELVTAIRSHQALRGTPIVMLTAKSDEASKLVGTDVGADAFLGKPFNQIELGSTVRNLLQLKSGEKEIRRLNEYLTESVCKRYLSPDLVQEIIDGSLSLEDPAELRSITILFSDLKGFTATSEKLGPQGISAILNEYLTAMNEIIFHHGGTIDKFIGDAIMVLFGAPKRIDDAEQAKRAVACAMAMNEEMKKLAVNWKSLGAEHLCMRIGIHQGPAVVGNFGSEKRSDYTCIGPTVNLAARIESAGEPRRVFVSQTVAQHLAAEDYETAGDFQLKGVEKKQVLYRIKPINP